MMDAAEVYEKIALSLQGLDSQDQEWLLQQLDAADRERVETMLRDWRDTGITATPATDNVDASVATAAADDDATLVRDADPFVLELALRDEPTWVLAALLAQCSASVALREYVSQLSPARVGEVRALVRPMRQSVKPRVREVVLHSVAEQIRRHASTRAEAVDFDAMLARVSG